MGKSIILFLSIIVQINSFCQELTNEELFENSIYFFREKRQIFDSIISNYNNKETMLYSLRNFDTVYFYNDYGYDFISKDSLSKYGLNDKTLIEISQSFLDSVGIFIYEVPTKQPNVLFNGVIIYKRDIHNRNKKTEYSWQGYFGSYEPYTNRYFSYSQSKVNNQYRKLRKNCFPVFYLVDINKQRFIIDNYFTFDYEIDYINRNENNNQSDFPKNFSGTFNRYPSLRKQMMFFRFQKRNVNVVYRGNRILYYQVFTGGYFGDAEKVKPSKEFKKLILK